MGVCVRARAQAKIGADGRHRFAPSPKTLCVHTHTRARAQRAARSSSADAARAPVFLCGGRRSLLCARVRRSDCNAFILRRDGTCYGCLTTRDVKEAGAHKPPLPFSRAR